MASKADILYDERRANAAPGGFHDRMIHILGNVLPAAVGAILAVMIVLPLFPKSEVSFLLDRNRVAITEDRMVVNSATYRGEDNYGRIFSVSAARADQHSAQVPIVRLNGLVARMTLANGTASAEAPTGDYHIDTDRVIASGPVHMTTSTGYAMETSAIAIDLRNHRAFGDGGVTGTLATGPFSAERIAADLSSDSLVLDGHVHLRMNQGKAKVLR